MTRGYCGQGSTLTVREADAVLPRESVAVTRIVTFPPTRNGPISALHVEPARDICALPDPLGPLQRRTTEDSRLSSVTLALTATSSHEGLASVVGLPTTGLRSSTSETLTVALPVAHEMPIDPAEGPSRTWPRSARTASRDDVPGATRPVDGEADSQAALDVRR
jgi:hypothetical protein